MTIELPERFTPAKAASGGDVWSHLAAQAYERGASHTDIQHAASACNPKLDAPIAPAERLLPLPDVSITETPIWRMNEGCRQVPRRPGAA